MADTEDFYDTDVFTWSQIQADLLRRFAKASDFEPSFWERFDLKTPDWPNIIEEIESVGRSELRAVESLLIQAMRHELKIVAWPNATYVSHWRSEVRFHRLRAQKIYRPSMEQQLDLEELYEAAKARVADDVDGISHGPLPDRCPWTLHELLSYEKGLPRV